MSDKLGRVRRWDSAGISSMKISDAIDICEGVVESSEEEEIKAWQFLINNGVCWELQGWYGRTAMRLIEDGVCHEASQR